MKLSIKNLFRKGNGNSTEVRTSYELMNCERHNRCNHFQMKTTITVLAIIFFCSFTKGGEKKNTDEIPDYSNVALIVIGHIVNTGFDFEKAKCRLYRDNHFVAGGITNKFGKIELQLMRNSRYLLEISTPGFVSKKIYFNTFLEEENKKVRFFDFEVELLFNEKEDGKMPCELDIPFALIYFNEQKKEFVHDEKYTEQMMELEKSILN